MSKDNQANKERFDSPTGDMPIIQNAASILYMRKNANQSRKRTCPLETVNASLIDYKNLKLIEQFVSERGKILPSRITGVSASKQRALKTAIKRARALALLPFENN